MSDIQVRIEHFPEYTFPYVAEVYVDGNPTQIRGHATTKLEAIEEAQRKFELSLMKQDDEWLPLYVEPIASQKARPAT